MTNQSLVRITKQFNFESAHALWNYDGPCRNIHGHSYVLYVTVRGRPIEDASNPKVGMLIDFSDLKKIVNTTVIDLFDHALIVNANTPHEGLAHDPTLYGKVLTMPYQPTCENMIVDFAARIAAELPPHIELYSLRLHETATSFVEWVASD